MHTSPVGARIHPRLDGFIRPIRQESKSSRVAAERHFETRGKVGNLATIISNRPAEKCRVTVMQCVYHTQQKL